MHLVKELWPRGRGAHGARDPCHEGTRKTRTPRGAAPTTAGPGHVARRRGSLLEQKGRAGGREDLLSEGTRRQVMVWAEGTQARPTEVTSERASLWGQTSFSLRRPRPRNTLVLPRHTPLGDESGQGPCARRKAGPAASWEIARPCEAEGEAEGEAERQEKKRCLSRRGRRAPRTPHRTQTRRGAACGRRG